MVAALQKNRLSSRDREEQFERDFKMLDNSEDLFFKTLDEPTKNKKQRMCAKSYMPDLFDETSNYQIVKTTEYREIDRLMTPKLGINYNHLDDVRRFILQKGFEELLIICLIQILKYYSLKYIILSEHL